MAAFPAAARLGEATGRPTADGPPGLHAVRQFPPGPGSVSLFFTALGGLGAVHFGRSARKVHLSQLPDWYHTGGPDPIGHDVALDLEYAPSAICALDVLADRQLLRHYPRRDVPSRCEDQSFLPVRGARAPPGLCS